MKTDEEMNAGFSCLLVKETEQILSHREEKHTRFFPIIVMQSQKTELLGASWREEREWGRGKSCLL